MKQSIAFIGLQLLNIVIGLYTTVVIAGGVEPYIYSLLLIYQVILGFYASFTSIGYETILLRNSLKWKGKSQSKLRYFITYSLYFRVIVFILLLFPASIYLIYISYSNYSGMYLDYLLLFNLSALFYCFINWSGLILKSFNQYLISFCVITIGSLLTKLVGYYFFIKYGFESFIITLVFFPFFTMIIAVAPLLKYVKCYKISIRRILFAKKKMSYGGIGYLKYLLGHSDRLIVSLFLRPEFQATYGLIKQFHDIAKSFVEGFFDPLIQKVVSYKATTYPAEYIRKLYKIQLVSTLIIVLASTIFFFFIDEIIEYLNFEKFRYIKSFALAAILSIWMYLSYKVVGNIVSLFETPNRLMTIDFISWVLSFFVIFACNELNLEEYLYLNRLTSEVVLFIIFYSYWIRFRYKYFLEVKV